MEWTLIGLIVGIVLGLTGAGGAIVAIPLFHHLVGVQVHIATIYSLFAVIIGAFLNWAVQRKKTDYVVAILMATFSSVGTVAVRQLKPLVSDAFIVVAISSLGAFSLYSVWRKKRTPVVLKADDVNGGRVLRAAASGVALGAVTTLTGLGGGVVIVPWLVGAMRLSFDRAVATSLFTIVLVSSLSLAAQFKTVGPEFSFVSVAWLTGGSVTAVFAVRALVGKLDKNVLEQARRWVLTAVILFSVIALLLRH